MAGLENGVLPEASPEGSAQPPLSRESYSGCCLLSRAVGPFPPPHPTCSQPELLSDCVFSSSCRLTVYSFIHSHFMSLGYGYLRSSRRRRCPSGEDTDQQPGNHITAWWVLCPVLGEAGSPEDLA